MRTMDTNLRKLLRIHGVAWLASAAVALPAATVVADMLGVTATAVAVAGVALAVLGADALVLAALAPDRLRPLAPLFAVVQELVVVAFLVAGLGDGVGRADAVVAAWLAEAAVFGALELRGARRAHATPALAR